MLFSEVVKGIVVKCDSCKEIYIGEDILLKPAISNIKMIAPMLTFKFVDKDGHIKGGYKGPDSSVGDQVAHCPLCDHAAITGFDVIS